MPNLRSLCCNWPPIPESEEDNRNFYRFHKWIIIWTGTCSKCQEHCEFEEA